MNPPATTSPFAPTRWTLVLRAQGATPEARIALSELCGAYYQPVFRFLCREGRPTDAAQELAQEFFARVLRRGELGNADPARGRFRSYLLGALKHFLVDCRKRAGARKRGGGVEPASLDAPLDETGVVMDMADARASAPDEWFDREWALAIMDRALTALKAEFEAAGKAEQFECLKPWLAGEVEALSQAEAARHLHLNEGAVKVAVHRLRKRFRELIRAEIAQTMPAGGDVDEELSYLIRVLAQRA
jgi:RNA polymerase sigma factor (sigma-70 family)